MVLIGAGSAVFTKGLVLDIMERPGEQWHISLVDIDPDALDVVERLCRKMLTQKRPDITLSASVDRRDVLSGADYVVTTIGVGSRRAWEQDVFIPRRYGVFQPVGDTVGPGGISRAMRMIPPMVEIAKDVAKFCPDALFVNYANPMTLNCMAVRRATGVPIIGLCHGVHNGIAHLADLMELRHNDLAFLGNGFNHMTFLYHLRSGGDDLFPRIVRRLSEDGTGRIGPLTAEYIARHHAYVVTDDRHFSEFVPALTAKNAYYGRTLGVDAYSFEDTIRRGDEVFERYRRDAHQPDPFPESYFRRGGGEHEQLLDILAAIEFDRPSLFYANLPNQGAIACLPDDLVLERPTLFSGSGIHPLQTPDFPSQLLPLMMRYTAIYEMAVQAALTGNTYLLRCAIEESTLPIGTDAVARMTDELLAAHRAYLPQFA